jgi:hypothetical protein
MRLGVALCAVLPAVLHHDFMSVELQHQSEAGKKIRRWGWFG